MDGLSSLSFAAWHNRPYHVPVILTGICVRKSNSKLRFLRHSCCQGKFPGWIMVKLNAETLKGQLQFRGSCFGFKSTKFFIAKLYEPPSVPQ